jgi:hypothetical protein
VPQGYFNAFVLRPGLLYEQHWTRIVGGVLLPSSSERYAHVIMTMAGIGGAILAARLWKSRPRPTVPHELRLAWIMTASTALIVLVLALLFHARGGDLTPRYILPVVWLQMLLLLAPMTWPRSPWLAIGILFSMAMMHFLVMEAYAGQQITDLLVRPDRPNRKGIDFALAIGIRKSGVPRPEVWFVGAMGLFITGLVLVVRSVAEAYRSTLARRESPDLSEPPAA